MTSVQSEKYFKIRTSGAFQEFGADVRLEDNFTITGQGTVTVDNNAERYYRRCCI